MAYSARNKIVGIYMLVFPGGIYVGSSREIQKRFVGHRNLLKNGKHTNTHLQRAYDKYGEPEYRIVVICRPCDILFYEQLFIDKLQPRYNISKIAGKVDHGPETRKKMSDTMKGRTHSQETRAKIRASLKGRRPPDSLYEAQKAAAAKRRAEKPPRPTPVPKDSVEFRAKMREIAIKRLQDPEVRRRISETMKSKFADPAQRQQILAKRQAARLARLSNQM